MKRTVKLSFKDPYYLECILWIHEFLENKDIHLEDTRFITNIHMVLDALFDRLNTEKESAELDDMKLLSKRLESLKERLDAYILRSS